MIWKLKTFTELTNQELYQLLRLRAEIFVMDQQCLYLDPDGHDLKAYHLLCFHQDQLVSYSRILPSKVVYPQASFGRIVVDKAYRGQGLAKELVTRAIQFLEDNLKEPVIKIQAQAYLQSFYAAYGFEAISDVYLDHELSHIDMIRQT